MAKIVHPNLRQLRVGDPVGSPVVVVKDDRSLWATTTRSNLWEGPGNRTLVLLSGISGGYDAARVYVAEEVTP